MWLAIHSYIYSQSPESWPQNVLMREQRFSFPMVLYRVLLTKTAIIWICLLFTNVNDATHCYCWAIAKCQQCGVECIHTHIFKAFIISSFTFFLLAIWLIWERKKVLQLLQLLKKCTANKIHWKLATIEYRIVSTHYNEKFTSLTKN